MSNGVLLAASAASGSYIIYKSFQALGGRIDGLKTGDIGAVIQSTKGLPLFAYHPLLVTSGLLFLAPLSWATIQARRKEIKKNKRILLTQAHAGLIFLAVVSTAGGLYAIYTNKNNAGKPHLTSPHSKVGVAFVVLIIASYVTALAKVLNVNGKGGDLPNFNWNCKWHKVFGKAALVASGFAISTGLYSSWGKRTFPDDKIRAGVALTIMLSQVLTALEVPSLLLGSKKAKK